MDEIGVHCDPGYVVDRNSGQQEFVARCHSDGTWDTLNCKGINLFWFLSCILRTSDKMIDRFNGNILTYIFHCFSLIC